MSAFRVNNDAIRVGCHLVGEMAASYADLVAAFGPPTDGDGYKVSSEWTFTSESGQTFTLYDYKATNLYHLELPSVEDFREEPSYDWHIGGNVDPTAFIAWVREQIAAVSQEGAKDPKPTSPTVRAKLVSPAACAKCGRPECLPVCSDCCAELLGGTRISPTGSHTLAEIEAEARRLNEAAGVTLVCCDERETMIEVYGLDAWADWLTLKVSNAQWFVATLTRRRRGGRGQ